MATTTMTVKAAAAATATATATAKTMIMISQSYRAWQVPALGSKGAAIRLFPFKLTATMLRMMAMMMMKATAAATATATVTVTMMSMISQLYRAWQVSALRSKGAAIRLFLFKPSDHVKSDGDDDDDSDRRILSMASFSSGISR